MKEFKTTDKSSRVCDKELQIYKLQQNWKEFKDKSDSCQINVLIVSYWYLRINRLKLCLRLHSVKRLREQVIWQQNLLSRKEILIMPPCKITAHEMLVQDAIRKSERVLLLRENDNLMYWWHVTWGWRAFCFVSLVTNWKTTDSFSRLMSQQISLINAML